MKRRGHRHIVIPDTQVRPGLSLDHFTWIGRYIADKQPNVIVHLGDHWDMPSLCEYDRMKRPGEFHSRSYQRDLDAGTEALSLLNSELSRVKGYVPRKIFCEGNHDERVSRLLRAQPNLQGALTTPAKVVEAFGWEFIDYLYPVVVDHVAYCHQFVKSANGRVVSTKYGAPNARTQVVREMRSATAGHKPGLDVHILPAGNRSVRGIIAGSCYMHNPEYETVQGNRYWRGILVKNEVRHGEYDLLEVSLDYLKRRYS